jgi:hypothetical protein
LLSHRHAGPTKQLSGSRCILEQRDLCICRCNVQTRLHGSHICKPINVKLDAFIAALQLTSIPALLVVLRNLRLILEEMVMEPDSMEFKVDPNRPMISLVSAMPFCCCIELLRLQMLLASTQWPTLWRVQLHHTRMGAKRHALSQG